MMVKDTPYPVDSIEEAGILLDGTMALKPGTSEYDLLYVPRPHAESKIPLEATRAERSGHPFNWCFTGHTGSGKSTELNRIITDARISENFFPIILDLESDFDISSIQYADLVLAMGKCCVQLADENSIQISEPIQEHIANWGSEFFSEEEIHRRTEGHGGLKFSLPFFALGEEIRSGGGKREGIRKKISTDIIDFIRLLNALANNIHDQKHKNILCILDGLDHLDDKPCFELLNNHFKTITLPMISKIFVIPLSLLNRPFQAIMDKHFSTVPNIKVYAEPGSKKIDDRGFGFYKNVISRYVTLDIFTPKTLESLFKLSGGIVRDMIRNTGNACAYASENESNKVKMEHAELVWNESIRFYRNQLEKKDFDVLIEVNKNPKIMGIDGLPPLLNNKAVIFYPNGEGWHGVHPAIQRIIG